MRLLPLAAFALFAHSLATGAEPIHVLVWDERQPRQAEAYDDFLGNEIVDRFLGFGAPRFRESGIEVWQGYLKLTFNTRPVRHEFGIQI